jgi:hypothetical protein
MLTVGPGVADGAAIEADGAAGEANAADDEADDGAAEPGVELIGEPQPPAMNATTTAHVARDDRRRCGRAELDRIIEILWTVTSAHGSHGWRVAHSVPPSITGTSIHRGVEKVRWHGASRSRILRSPARWEARQPDEGGEAR